MEELSAEAREILSEMRRADAPRAGARARVRHKLTLSVGGTAALSVAATAAGAPSAALAGQASAAALASSALGGVSLAKLTLLVALGALGTSALLTPLGMLSEAPRSAASSPASRPLPLAAPVSPSRTPALPSSSPSAPATETAPAPSVRARVASHISAAGSRQPAPRPSGSLASETRLLEAVRAHLRAGRAGEGIALLDEHARLHAAGALREEAAASRVFALCALGRVNEARSAAFDFRSAFPRSPLGPRVERACSAP